MLKNLPKNNTHHTKLFFAVFFLALIAGIVLFTNKYVLKSSLDTNTETEYANDGMGVKIGIINEISERNVDKLTKKDVEDKTKILKMINRD